MKRLTAIIAVTLVAAACSDSTLMDDLGERSHEYVVGSTTTTLFVASANTLAAGPGVIPIEDVRWFNEGIEGEELGEANIVIPTVWARGGEEGRFVQASPAEINIALPGMEFPAVVPQTSQWVTSQLVYDPASATLDPNTFAAFGLWSVPPYTDDAGRLAVLRVGQARDNASTGINSAANETGLNLVWSSGAYRYDLQCYPGLDQDVCWQMAEVMAPLASVAPPGIVESS